MLKKIRKFTYSFFSSLLKKAVTKVGYDADDLPADPKAYDDLPKCCKKDNEPH